MRRRHVLWIIPSAFAITAIIFACGDDKKPPIAGEADAIAPTDSRPFEPDTGPRDGGVKGDAEVPKSCNDTIKSGNETDVDCGGSVCPKCIDGKKCVAPTDCAGGACLAGSLVCVTPKCTDGQTNGDETDTDCGGTICARCTIGKACKAGTDCVSGACVGNACACPKAMTTVSRAGGNGAYCVDELEVSKFEYNKFINANVPIDDQTAECKPPANTTFVPRGAWPPAGAPPFNLPPSQGLAFNYALPVHYVDWCDAHAYCRWAKKQLCGSVTGGPVVPTKADSADAGAWYNACSAQGAKDWPWGTIFEVRCNGSGGSGDAGPIQNGFGGYGFGGANQDESVQQLHNGDVNGSYSIIYHAQCAGGSTGLYVMSGNVAEWEDSCDGTAPTSLCRVRGGSYNAQNDPAKMRCDAVRTEMRLPPPPGGGVDPLKDIGLRCCLY